MIKVTPKSIAVAYYVVHSAPLSDNVDYESVAQQLEADGHLTLLCACTAVPVMMQENYEAAANAIHPAVLSKYRCINKESNKSVQYLRTKDDKFARPGMVYNGHRLQSTLGRFCVVNGVEMHPIALNLFWK